MVVVDNLTGGVDVRAGVSVLACVGMVRASGEAPVGRGSRSPPRKRRPSIPGKHVPRMSSTGIKAAPPCLSCFHSPWLHIRSHRCHHPGSGHTPLAGGPKLSTSCRHPSPGNLLKEGKGCPCARPPGKEGVHNTQNYRRSCCARNLASLSFPDFGQSHYIRATAGLLIFLPSRKRYFVKDTTYATLYIKRHIGLSRLFLGTSLLCRR